MTTFIKSNCQTKRTTSKLECIEPRRKEKTKQSSFNLKNQSLMSTLNNFRLERRLCDVLIKVKDTGTMFPAHKVVLMANSKYFKHMLSGNFAEKVNNVIEIVGVTDMSMNAFLNFFYTGYLSCTKENMVNLIIDADYMSLLGIKDAAIAFMQKNIDLSNVFDIFYMAKELSCESLLKTCMKNMGLYFEAIALTEDFLKFDIESLKRLFSITVDKNAVTRFESIINWIIENYYDRSEYLTELLDYVRFSDLDNDYFQRYFYTNGVKSLGIMYFLMEEEVKSYFLNYKNSVINSNKYIIAIRKDTNAVELYNPLADSWMHPAAGKIRQPTFVTNAVVYKDKVYLIGSDACYVYDPLPNSWRNISPLNCRQYYTGAAILDNYIYVCGGAKNNRTLNLVERYCLKYEEWCFVKPMNTYRSNASVVALDGYIYVIGGYDKMDCLDTVERYDPAKDEWIILESKMLKKRSACGAAVLDGKIYVAGGTANRDVQDSVEVYDPKTQKWEYTASMNSKRLHFALLADDGKLWAIGCPKDLFSIEMYDLKTNAWRYMKPPLKLLGQVVGGIVNL